MTVYYVQVTVRGKILFARQYKSRVLISAKHSHCNNMMSLDRAKQYNI